jgi:hypothetical protein
MDFDNLDMSKTWYITVIVLFKDGTCKVEADSVQLLSSNLMCGFTETGKFEIIPLHPTRTWRAAAGRGTQNYYGRVCNGCKQMIACEKGCADLAEFKGHSK